MFYKVFILSRPRFWLYTAGPYLIGLSTISNLQLLYTFEIWYGLFYFLIPANLFIYTVNDYFDRTLDQQNPKKRQQEIYMKKHDQSLYRWIISISLHLSVPLFFTNYITATALGVFLLVGFFYSSPPIRFKTTPVLDSMSNFFYILPGIVSYSFVTFSFPSMQILLAGSLWAIALHLFSAIVDIESDPKAGIQTSATVVGYQRSLLVTCVLWLVSVILASNLSPLMLLGVVYPILPLIVLCKKHTITTVYWWMPWINAVLGFILFWANVYVM